MRAKAYTAVLGAGHWGENHVRILYNLGVLAAVADPHPAVRMKVQENYPGIPVFADYKEVLADKNVRAVVVAAPAELHREIAGNSLLAGKDVLLEKPMALTVAEATELKELAEQKGLVLMIGHQLLFHPAVSAMLEAIRNGDIGDVYFVEMQRVKAGRIRQKENVLWSFAPHDIAIVLSIIRSGLKNVTAVGQAVIQKRVEDNVHLHLEFSGNMKAHIHTSWLWPQNRRRTVVVGTKGILELDENNSILRFYPQTVDADLQIRREESKETKFEDADSLEREILHFLECVTERKTPLTGPAAGIEVVRVLEKASECLKKAEKMTGFFAHESAVIDFPCSIGNGTKIWHSTHIMRDVKIGQNCNIGQNVFIASGVVIGNHVKIQNNVSVYQGVTLEDYVFCGPSMVFTNVRTPRSRYPRNTARDYLATRVKKGATIGANATIVCGVEIGRYAFIGAGAVVTKDVPDHAVVYGNPATLKGWICKCGNTMVKPWEEKLVCEDCDTFLRIK